MPYPYAETLRVGHHVDGASASQATSCAKIQNFSKHHIGISTGYQIHTPPDVNILILPVREEASTASLVPAVIESWWYPKRIFLVFGKPEPGEYLEFNYGDPLAWIVPVPAARASFSEASEAEVAKVSSEAANYNQMVRERTDWQWVSAEGHHFSMGYRMTSRAHTRADYGNALHESDRLKGSRMSDIEEASGDQVDVELVGEGQPDGGGDEEPAGPINAFNEEDPAKEEPAGPITAFNEQ